MIKAATWYLKKGYAVVPIRDNKKPYIKWQEYQKKMPSEKQVKEWWQEWPEASIGIVTGAISNLTVIDVDSEVGRLALEEITPDNFITPTATTPSGGEHRYCEYDERIRNSVQFLQDCDIRSEGGYIIAPPSKNGRGEYKWVEGLSVAKVAVQSLPSSYIKNILIPYIGDAQEKGFKGLQGASRGFITLTETYKIKDHTRDNALFHIANSLIKAQISDEETQQILQLIAYHGCETPFPAKEVPIKIQSAINRVEREKSNWMAEVKELIRASEGIIRASECHRELQGASKREKRAITQCLRRCEKEGLIKKTGKFAGEYRIVKIDVQEVDWKNAMSEKIDLTMPLGIHECVKFIPSSIIMLSGVTNAGKTAFAMSIGQMNWRKMETRYYTSEIGGDEFRGRAVAHSDIEAFDGIRMFDGFKPHDLPDIINPDGLTLIDYLEPPGGDYTQVATVISEIQQVLQGGIAVICLQKKEGDDYGAGGQFIRNKCHLFCTLDPVEYPACKLTIRKAKATNHGYRNPGGQSVEYKIDEKNGVDIIPLGKLHFSRWDI